MMKMVVRTVKMKMLRIVNEECGKIDFLDFDATKGKK